MGYAHGLDAEFLCYEGRPFTLTEAIALAWVHGWKFALTPPRCHKSARLARYGSFRDELCRLGCLTGAGPA